MKKVFVCFALIVVVLLAPYTANAQPINLSLIDAVEMSVKTSEDVQMKQNDIEKTRQRIKQAWSIAYPQLDAEINYKWYPGVYEFEVDLGIPGQTPFNVSTQESFELAFGIQLNQLIYSFGRVKNGVQAAKRGKETTFLAKSVTSKEVFYNAAIAYLSVLFAKKSVEIMKASYENTKKNKELLLDRFKYGRIPRGDNIQVNADIAVRVPGLKKAQSSLELAMQALKMFTGIDQDREVILTDSLISKFPDYDYETYHKKMINEMPTLKLLRTNVKLYKNIEELMWAEYLPTINAFVSYNYSGFSDKAYIGDKFQHLATLGLTLNIPIWNGGKTHSIHKQAQMDRKNAELELQKAVRGFSLQLRNAITQYNSLRETYVADLNAQELSYQSFLASRERFKSGEQKLTDLNSTEIWATQSKIGAAQTLYEINKTAAKIEKLTAGVGDESWKKRLEK